MRHRPLSQIPGAAPAIYTPSSFFESNTAPCDQSVVIIAYHDNVLNQLLQAGGIDGHKNAGMETRGARAELLGAQRKQQIRLILCRLASQTLNVTDRLP